MKDPEDKEDKWQGPSDPDIATQVQYRLIEKIAESERRHRELLARLPDIVLRIDEQGTTLYVNEAWQSVLGHSIDEVVGREVLPHIAKEDQSKWLRLVAATGEQPHGKKGAGRSEHVRFRDHEGSIHWMHPRLRRLESGETVGSLEDVTLQRKLEAELLRGQRLESIGRLAGGLVHDFNNLLTSIMTNVDLAKARLGKNDLELKELELARRACAHASQITKQMLTFTKGGEPIRRPACLTTLVREATDLALRGGNITTTLDLLENAPLVQMDVSQMHQVINNLILNAQQAMPEGGGLHIRVYEEEGAKTPASRRLILEIVDQGPGISQENIERVLEPYFTTKETGSGLGLASAYSIVTRHEGSFEIESEVGIGTTIRIALPTTLEGEHAPRAAESLDVAGRSGRILLMDDDDSVRASLLEMLELLDHEAVGTRGGEECVAVFQEAIASGTQFDLVILDLTIAGGRDGIWTIKRLLEIAPGTKALVLSGFSEAPVLSDPSQYGFQAVLTKPFLMEDLEQTVAHLLAPS